MTQQEKPKPRWVKDQLSQWHELTEKLDSGGQGVVYRTSDPELLVKMALKKDDKGNTAEITDKTEVAYFQEQFEHLYLLPLTEAMHITKPLYLLAEQAGYVMQMMQDMQPIGEWLPQKVSNLTKKEQAKYKPPTWLSEDVPLEAAYPFAMYAESDGTKRRLELLAQATIELIKLHSVGVIFMDVSPENIFCSTNRDHSEVWLIDADNLDFEEVNSNSGMKTKNYVAPEIAKGEDGARVGSDAYSLSLLAFEILAMTKAFNGQRFKDAMDEEEDWAADETEAGGPSLEVQAEQGELPFVFDAEDDSNSSVDGLPSNLALTPALLRFFQTMFGAGRTEPWRRPSLYSLPRLLTSAADASISCVCGMSFYYQSSTAKHSCPYCQHTPQELLVATSYFYTKEGADELAWTWVTPFTDGQNLRIPRRLSGSFEIDSHNTPLLEINQIEQDWFIYMSAEGVQVDMADHNGHFQPLVGQWLLEKQQLEEGVQLYLHAPYSAIIEIKVQKNNAI